VSLCLGVILLSVLTISAQSSCASRPKAPDPRQGPTTVLVNQAGAPWTVQVELARTREEHAQGLMFRWELKPDHGMLFIFSDSQKRNFWMKNTRIPLDMIFIAPDRRIAGIAANTEPYTETSRGVDAPSQWVLEVAGGEAQKHGLAAGDRVYFFGVPGLEEK
jgi:uncharacterized protein